MINDRVDADLLDAAPGLRVVAQMAVGYDNIDVPAATARGVAVTNTPGVLTDATADMAFALLLAPLAGCLALNERSAMASGASGIPPGCSAPPSVARRSASLDRAGSDAPRPNEHRRSG